MSDFPSRARCVVIGCGIVGNSLVYHLTRLGWTDVVQIDKGPLPEPGRLHRPRLELRVPGRPQQGDDRAHGRELAPVPRVGSLHRVRRHRGRAHRGADGGAAPPDGVGEVVGHRGRAARDAGRDQGARAVHRRVDPARRLLLPDGRRRRLAAVRHALPREGDRSRAACRCSRAPRCTASTSSTGGCAPCETSRGDDRGRARRDRVRRLEPEGGASWPARTSR